VLYGDLDISLIDEMPPGRQPVYTERFGEGDRERAYRLLADELYAGHQAYVVAPLIEDSDVLDSRSAESLYREISGRFPDYKSALLHGQVPPKEKEAVMEQFYAGEIRILVSTVVIEVGIDVPNATVMLIEGAERFGLAQLHQLRGRVGRGRARSYCLIITDVTSGIADERADVFCRTSDGFVIAEKDLELRGPGELFGFRQHGLPELVLADPLRHARLFQESRDDARQLLECDPSLRLPENHAFGQRVRTLFERMEHVVL
jgi:ATP-dependent DNA helicase RecG